MDNKFVKLLIVIVFMFLLCGCFHFKERKEAKNKAYNYFAKKYNIDKKDLKTKNNYLYYDGKLCLTTCSPSYITFKYKNNEYKISDEYHDLFDEVPKLYDKETGNILAYGYYNDNFQSENIINDLKQNLESNSFVILDLVTYDPLYYHYYDGTNLKDVLKEFNTYKFYLLESNQYNYENTLNYLINNLGFYRGVDVYFCDSVDSYKNQIRNNGKPGCEFHYSIFDGKYTKNNF